MPSLIAIDLGSHAVKVAALRRTGRTYELEDQVTQLVPQSEDESPDLGARLAALDVLLAENPSWQTPGAEKVLVWPSSQAVFRRLLLPFTDKAQVEQTLPFTVEGEVPHDLDEMVMASRVMSVKEGEGTEVCVVLASEEAVGEVLNALATRKLDPSRVMLDADVLAFAAPRRDTSLVAVVDVGHTHTAVSVVLNGRMELSRSIDVGGRDLTLALAEASNRSYSDAEDVKNGSKPESWTAPMRDAVNGKAALLLAELRAFLITAEDQLHMEVDEVRLSGGGARYAPLAGFLQSDLQVPVRWAQNPETGGDLPNEHAAAQSAAWTAAGSSAVTPIDLRVGALSYRGGRDFLMMGGLFLVLAVVFLTVASLGIFVVRYTQMGSELAEVESLIVASVTDTYPSAEPSSLTSAFSDLNNLVVATEDRARVMGSGGGEPPTVQLLAELTQNRPPHTEVTINADVITISPKMITMKAETTDYTSAAKIEERLKDHHRFQRAEKSDERKKRDTIEFTITIPLDAGDEADEEAN